MDEDHKKVESILDIAIKMAEAKMTSVETQGPKETTVFVLGSKGVVCL